jgi:hypothetical protein
MTLAYHKTLNFAGSPTVWDMINDPSFIRIIRGAVGSGKSTGMCAEIMRLAMCQEPAEDGWRYCKAGVVRNTYGELMTTTLATWRSIYPEEVFGPIRHGAPITHHIRIPGDNGNPGIDLLVEFMALDRVRDVKKLLSWEGSVIWFNELREVAKQIFDAATARVGRYPSKAQRGVNCTRAAILGDTNPPDEDHWLYALERDDPEGFAFFDQPPAVLELHEVDWAYQPCRRDRGRGHPLRREPRRREPRQPARGLLRQDAAGQGSGVDRRLRAGPLRLRRRWQAGGA